MGEKRVELHLHTNMSQMQGITSVQEYIEKGLEYKMTALAITDYENVQAFSEVYFLQKYLTNFGYDKIKVLYGLEANIKLENDKIYHATIIVKNKLGLKNLYKLVSFSYLKYYEDKPIILYEVYKEYSEGLIIGACFNDGELYNAIINKEADNGLKNIANKYDYLEICPVNEDKIKIVKKIIEISNIANKIVVATGNVYYIEPKENLYYKILASARDEDIEEDRVLNYFRTTGEMLQEFEYLGKETAYEVVVTNTNKIADMCEKIQSMPNEKYYPHLKNENERIIKLAHNGLKTIFDNQKIPTEYKERLEKELKSITENNFATIYLIAYELVKKSNEDGYFVGNRGGIASSLVAYCLGITEVDPIKYNIPFETFADIDGDREPDIDLNFAGEYQETAQEYMKNILEGATTYKAGTIAELNSGLAYVITKRYFDKIGKTISEEEIIKVSEKLIGVKKTTGQHPRRSYSCS